jgi:hypothetical protein
VFKYSYDKYNNISDPTAPIMELKNSGKPTIIAETRRNNLKLK